MKVAILLLITVLVASAQKCHPECSWKCDDPKCDAICEPICEPPSCHSSCQEPKNAVCDVKCERPDCSIMCPDKACEFNDCPKCVTICKPPHCVTHCQVISIILFNSNHFRSQNQSVKLFAMNQNAIGNVLSHNAQSQSANSSARTQIANHLMNAVNVHQVPHL